MRPDQFDRFIRIGECHDVRHPWIALVFPNPDEPSVVHALFRHFSFYTNRGGENPFRRELEISQKKPRHGSGGASTQTDAYEGVSGLGGFQRLSEQLTGSNEFRSGTASVPLSEFSKKIGHGVASARLLRSVSPVRLSAILVVSQFEFWLPRRPLSPLSIHASFRRHLWTFLQAGQCIVSVNSKVSRIITSVVTPVGTGFPNIGQRIIMSATIYPVKEPRRA